MNKTKHPHFVYADYLDSWTRNTGKICVSRGGEPFWTSPRDIAKEKDFYRLISLSESEKQVLYQWVVTYGAYSLLKSYKQYELITECLDDLEELGKDKLDLSQEQREGLASAIDLLRNNIPEHYFSKSEHIIQNFIHHILLDPSYFGGEIDESELVMAICTQYFRTKRMRDVMKSSLSTHRQNSNNPVDCDKISKVLLWAYGNVEENMASKYKVDLLLNESKEEFITTDQPVINLDADYNTDEVPTGLTLYYPISPKYALFISSDSTHTIKPIDEMKVAELNRKIAQASYECIFANSEELCKKGDSYRHIKR